MPQTVRNDLNQLKIFIETYSLSGVASNPDYKVFLSRNHRKYLALLICISEFSSSGFTAVASSRKLSGQSKIDMTNYTREAVSDLGCALFTWMHGCYKPTRLIIRSSIENFIRGVSVTEDPTIVNENNVYNLFDRASNLHLFTTEPSASIFHTLNSIYGQLCADVHTASNAHMQNISALNYFPAFDVRKAEINSRLFSNICQQFLSVLCFCFRDVFFGMHPENRDIILENLSQPVKEAIYNPE
jgi:hypothetical protein